MNSQDELFDNEQSKKEFINGMWVDVKLCTLKAKNFCHQLPASALKKRSSANNIDFTTPYYDELHYGNYE